MQHDCDCIAIGDVVEHKMNTNVFGIVIGFAGSVVYLRASPSLATRAFHEWELRPMDDDGEPEPDEPAENDNVVDFTRAKELRANTKTKGAA